MTLYSQLIDSPIGMLTLVADDQGLVAILWPEERPNRVPLDTLEVVPSHPILDMTREQLQGYFAGERQSFDVPLSFRGTEFQRKVWAALLTIPFGQTRTYSQIARQIGHPDAVRAVGAANGRNPISIIAPCHRVIGANGSLTGFAGGLAAKRWLLALEGHVSEQSELAL